MRKDNLRLHFHKYELLAPTIQHYTQRGWDSVYYETFEGVTVTVLAKQGRGPFGRFRRNEFLVLVAEAPGAHDGPSRDPETGRFVRRD